jgi:hypothetical protein
MKETLRGLFQSIQYSDWLRAGQPRDRRSNPGKVKNFHYCTFSRGSKAYPVSYPMANRDAVRVKRPCRQAEHSPQTSAEVKKTWINISTPHTSP